MTYLKNQKLKISGIIPRRRSIHKGSIIPFASGAYLYLLNKPSEGESKSYVSIAFGEYGLHILHVDAYPPPTITLTGGTMAFVVPHKSRITNLSGYFNRSAIHNPSVDSSIPIDGELYMALYQSTTLNSTFSLLSTTVLNLVPAPSVPDIPQYFSASKNLNIPIQAGSKIMLIVYFTSETAHGIEGFCGGSITVK